MFERFRAMYASSRDSSTGRAAWRSERLATIEGYPEFAAEFAGASFGGGLYRIHDEASGAQALQLASEVFPEFRDRACPFAYDWLGRQFAVDAGRVVNGQPQVLLLEPGTGEALEIPLSFATFHDEELTDYADAALATNFFAEWAGANSDVQQLDRDQCVGYRVPLFLGGRDEIDNLELSELDVYWSICGQLRRGVLNLPPGTSINEIVQG